MPYSATASVYELNGDVATPQEPARSGWDPRLVNGSSTSALLAAVLERDLAREGHAPARFIVDMLRPIPFADARVESVVTRMGGRLALGDVSMFVGDKLVARASGMYLAQNEGDEFATPNATPTSADQLRNGVLLPDFGSAREQPPFQHFCDIRWATEFEATAPVVWFRPPPALIGGLPPSDTVRAVAVADLLAGLTVTHQIRSGFPHAAAINADQHIVFAGAPVGEWFALRMERVAASQGAGFASADVLDSRGLRGRVTHTRVGNRPQARSPR
ncbi:MAG: hypothetical protein ACJAYU_000043 [Bradymonadia bacterium]|jgi:hypothetical protein